ncbi:hypothetical protein LTR65_010872 [Meristemomyces frigidus]
MNRRHRTYGGQPPLIFGGPALQGLYMGSGGAYWGPSSQRSHGQGNTSGGNHGSPFGNMGRQLLDRFIGPRVPFGGPRGHGFGRNGGRSLRHEVYYGASPNQWAWSMQYFSR